MSETTPGPWTVTYVSKNADGNYGTGFALPCIIPGKGPVIAELLRSPRALADAHLIAAAPDLLAAARKLSEVADSIYVKISEQEMALLRAAWRDLDAAIAKATNSPKVQS